MMPEPRSSRLRPGTRLRVLARLTPLLLAPAPLLAQGQTTLRITQPDGWDAGTPWVAQAGTSLRIAGVAADASGVRLVLVNGALARLKLDPQARGQVRFEADLVVASGLREVVVLAQPNRGNAVERRLRLDVRAAPSAPSVRPGSATVPDSANTVRQIPELAAIKVPPPAGNPWGHYALRGIAYAAGAGAGLYVASRKTVNHTEICTGPAGRQDCVDRTDVLHNSLGKGLGIAGAAAGIALIDAALTAHRAHARATAEVEPPPRARTGLQPPALDVDARGARIALVRVKF
ncbi:MAG TPA: hypothetical protein VF832_00710 [Longimicrobiales bacterium]